MESNKHVFMRKLLTLCKATGVDSGSCDKITVYDIDGGIWIDALEVHLGEGGYICIGYWDGERHEVSL